MPKKNNIMFIKPQEPSFISRMKAEAGYKEGDTVETKRQAQPNPNDEDFEDRDEEQPVVVVLKPGDISAEEAELIKSLQKEEAEQTPANLSDRIVFRARTKPETPEQSVKRPSSSEDHQSKRSKRKAKPSSLLSFDDQEEDDDAT